MKTQFQKHYKNKNIGKKFDFITKKIIDIFRIDKIFISTKGNIFYYLLSYILICFFISSSIEEELGNNISYSQIIITLNKGGNQEILSSERFDYDISIEPFNNIPDEIYVNGKFVNYTGKIVKDLKEQLNNITLIWKEPLTDCSAMFLDLTNIIKIDLSKFNTSLVTKMACMFNGCDSLEFINLDNFNTSLVNTMYFMF